MKKILPWQCRAARAAINLSADKLGKACELSRWTIETFERGGAIADTSVEKILQALEAAGVSFYVVDGKDCVALARPGASHAPAPDPAPARPRPRPRKLVA